MMRSENEFKEEAYQNYIQQYPSYKDFFDNVIKGDKILYKIWYYTYLPTEEVNLRTTLKKQIQKKEYDYLLGRATREKTKELETLFDDLGIVAQADLIFQDFNPKKNSVEGIRSFLRKRVEKTFDKDGKKISEVKVYRYFPGLMLTERNISNGKRKIEIEIEYFLKTDFQKEKERWEAFSITEILQTFRDMSEIVGITWNIKPEVEYSIILCHGKEKKEFPINLLHRKRYYNLIRKAMRKYPLEGNEIRRRGESPELRLGDYDKLKDELNFSDAIMAILNLSLAYDQGAHGHFPGYLEKRLKSHLRDIWKKDEFTTTQLFKERKSRKIYQERKDRQFSQDNEVYNEFRKKRRENYRILRTDLDYSGGSLNEDITEDDGEVIGIKQDLVEEDGRVAWPQDQLMYFKEIRDSLSDSIDKEIFVKYYGADETPTKIGLSLRLTRQAVSKRIDKIKSHIKKLMEREQKI